MSEKLIIKNFGPIKEMSFDLKKVNIFIGDQGTGKSTVAKVLTAIKNSIFREIFDLKETGDLIKETQQFYGHLDLFGIKSFLKKETLLIYKCPYYGFELKENQVTVSKNISFEESSYFNFNYIPAERNMVHVLADSLYGLLEIKAELPKLFLRFGNKYQTSRKSKNEFDYTDILGVKFTHKNDKDYIIVSDGNEINLSDGSSGIQGCVALLTVVDNILSESLRTDKSLLLLKKNLKLLIIEEPELNCFPQTQYKLIKYIIEKNKISNVREGLSNNAEPEFSNINFTEDYDTELKNQLLITTHSPYILTSLNNLMYAYDIGQKEPEEVNKIIEKKYWINSGDVCAYRLLPDGTCEDIIANDEAGRLIRAEKIDEISGFLNEQFDKLLNLEFVQK
jgi:hypothetical protein